MLGHKGDLMLVHFRKNFEELAGAQMAITRLRLNEYLDSGDAKAPPVKSVAIQDLLVKPQ